MSSVTGAVVGSKQKTNWIWIAVAIGIIIFLLVYLFFQDWLDKGSSVESLDELPELPDDLRDLT